MTWGVAYARMIIRVRAPTGTLRLEMKEKDTMLRLYELVHDRLGANLGGPFVLRPDPISGVTFAADESLPASHGLGHGDMVYLDPLNARVETSSSNLDGIDLYLEQQAGKIIRKRDISMCKHGERGMCEHCQPLEPYDPGYLEANKIKHMSFHAYLRKIMSGTRRNVGSQSEVILEEPDYKVKRSCPNHAPYPAGICSSCQPSAITLNPQLFRMVDHVEFETPAMIDEFISEWRQTGYQHFGYLYGRYEPYELVPLGIKAVVAAIYEPPQDGATDGFHVLEDLHSESVNMIASELDLHRIGIIYTDLRDDGTGKGKVEYKRNKETFFVSSAECLFMAQQQLKHRSPSKYSATGYFGSKFVTIIITGDRQHSIALDSYQVSNQCVALVDADLVEATINPALMRVKASIPGFKYVPEVFYKMKNEYGIETVRAATPTFPVEYLLVSLTHGFPLEPNSSFTASVAFPTMKWTSSPPTIQTVKRYLSGSGQALATLLCNFNLLIFFGRSGLVSDEDLLLLLKAIKNKDDGLFSQFQLSSSWKTVQTLLAEEDSLSSSDTGLDRPWACPHCTYVNSPRIHPDTCEMCGLPRYS